MSKEHGEEKVLTQKQLINILDHGKLFYKTEKEQVVACDHCFESPITSGISWQDHTHDLCLDCVASVTEQIIKKGKKPKPQTKMVQKMFSPKQTLMLQSANNSKKTNAQSRMLQFMFQFKK